MRFLSNDLSTVHSCDTLITELLLRFARRLERYALPGAAASFVLDVTTAAITVRIALRLNVSACAITIGCPKARAGTGWVRQVRPPNLTSGDRHWFFFRE